MTRPRGNSIEGGLAGLIKESASLAQRLSWKGAALLGLALFLVVGVLIPYAFESWSESQMQAQQSTAAGRIAGPAFHQLLIIRAIFPMKVMGAIAGIVCGVIAIYKLIREILSA